MTDTFKNSSFFIEDLPQVKSTDYIPVEKNYLRVLIISSCIFFGLILIGLVVTFLLNWTDEWIWYSKLIVLIVVIIIWASNLIYIKKAFKNKMYVIRERDIIYKKGLFWTTRTSIPFNRIQHAELKQGPIDRHFKLNSLKVYTAGGHSSDLTIPGLGTDKAIQIKEFILDKTAKENVES